MTSPSRGAIDVAYVEIRPRVASTFQRDLEQQVDTPATRMAAKVGTSFGTVMGKGISVALNSNVQAGLGGVGLLVQKFADDQQQAQSKLAAAISGTGASVDDYQSRIDAAVKSNERLGLSQDKTKSELAELTLALGSPEKALRELSTAQDIAAGTGRSFMSVVNLLRMTSGSGSVSAYKQLGLDVKDLAKAQKDLTTAQAASGKATDAVSKAQQSFNDKLAVYRQDSTHTLAQQQALYRSHEDLVKAQAASAAAAKKVTAAQKEVRSATYSQQQANEKLAQHYKGEMSSTVTGFTGKLKVLAAEAKDTAGTFVAKYGNAAGGIGFALLGVSRVTKVVVAAFRTMRDGQILASEQATKSIVANAAVTDAALASEATAAEGAVGRILTALGRIGPAVVVATAALNTLNDARKGNLTRTDLSGSQEQDFLLARGLLTSGLKDKTKNTLTKQLQSGNSTDLAAILQYLKANPLGSDFIPGGKLTAPQSAAIVKTVTGILAGRGITDTGAPDPKNSDNPLVATRAQGGKTGGISVPAGKALGKAAAKATGDSFADFLKQYDLGSPINAALSAAHDKAVAAAQKLVDDVTSRLDAARSKLQSDVLASKQLQLQIAQTVSQGSALADAFADRQSNVRNGLGDRPIAGQGGLKGVESFLHQRAVMIARFAKALTNLRKKGLDQRLIDEIAQLGTDQGLPIAEQILAGSSADVRSINTSEQQIARAANTVGQRFANNQYGDLIAADKANADALIRKLEELKAQLVRISRNPSAVNVDVKQTGASAKEVGQVVGTTIRQAMKGMS